MKIIHDTHYYTVKEVAHILRLAEGTLRNKLSKEDDLPKSKLIGGKRLFSYAEVHSWLSEKQANRY